VATALLVIALALPSFTLPSFSLWVLAAVVGSEADRAAIHYTMQYSGCS
jgi:hypothetical protein